MCLKDMRKATERLRIASAKIQTRGTRRGSTKFGMKLESILLLLLLLLLLFA
jgi:hypothetical protein